MHWTWKGIGPDWDYLEDSEGKKILDPVGTWEASPANPSGYGIRVSKDHARLIASAPDLLQAAKYALLALTDASEIDSDRRGAIAQLRAALQKAE